MKHTTLSIPALLVGIVLSAAVAKAASVPVTMRPLAGGAGGASRSDIPPADAMAEVDFVPRTPAAMVDTIERLAATPPWAGEKKGPDTFCLDAPTITDGNADHEVMLVHPMEFCPTRPPFARLLLTGRGVVEATGAYQVVVLPEPSGVALLASGGGMLAGWLSRRRRRIGQPGRTERKRRRASRWSFLPAGCPLEGGAHGRPALDRPSGGRDHTH